MENVLVIEGLCKEYPGFVLQSISFELPRGYVMGLIGPNGAGKTTVIKLILNAVKKDGGTIRVFGLDHEADEEGIKSRIGFVHETPPFYDCLSVKEFAGLTGLFYRRWSASTFGRLAADFELPLRKRIRTLSRGMKMKLALAIALAHDADLLLMDEPTSGLDPVFRRELLDRLYDLMQNENKSILFSTHITSDLEHIADYITFMRQGEICFSESTEVIREKWRLVKGGPELLRTEVQSLFRATQTHAYGFTALTDRPAEVRTLLGSQAVFERPSLEDLVYYLDGGNRRG